MKKITLSLLLVCFVIIIIISFVFVVNKKELTLENIYKYKIRNKLTDIDTIMALDRIIVNSQNQTFKEIFDSTIKNDIQLSFFIAGHAYGNHNVKPEIRDYMHPPFREMLPKISKSNTIDFGVFLGDIVYYPKENNIQNFINDMQIYGKPYYIAPGNHDLGIENDFFKNTNEYFIMNNNLFFILTPCYNWILDDSQMDLISTQLENNNDVDNIFVLTHYLFWLEENDTHFENIEPNGFTEKDGESNFWTEVMPLFNSIEVDVYFIAGDVGASINSTSYFYDKIDNYYFIATGMGGGVKDNILITEIDKENNVNFELIALNGNDFYRLGDLENTN